MFFTHYYHEPWKVIYQVKQENGGSENNSAWPHINLLKIKRFLHKQKALQKLLLINITNMLFRVFFAWANTRVRMHLRVGEKCLWWWSYGRIAMKKKTYRGGKMKIKRKEEEERKFSFILRIYTLQWNRDESEETLKDFCFCRHVHGTEREENFRNSLKIYFDRNQSSMSTRLWHFWSRTINHWQIIPINEFLWKFF